MSTIEQTTQAIPTGTWNVDPVHSEIAFSVEYMAGTFRGTFEKFDVQLVDGALSGTADVTSISVKDENLEAHLLSPTSSTPSAIRSFRSGRTRSPARATR